MKLADTWVETRMTPVLYFLPEEMKEWSCSSMREARLLEDRGRKPEIVLDWSRFRGLVNITGDFR